MGNVYTTAEVKNVESINDDKNKVVVKNVGEEPVFTSVVNPEGGIISTTANIRKEVATAAEVAVIKIELGRGGYVLTDVSDATPIKLIAKKEMNSNGQIPGVQKYTEIITVQLVP